MTTTKIEPDSLLHGLLNSDYDNGLLYHYDELLKAVADTITSMAPDKRSSFIDMLKNSVQRRIADNNRVIRDLQINVENEHIKEGFVSLNRVKLNNLQSVNEKSDCLIRDLEGLRRVKAEKKTGLEAPVIALFCTLANDSKIIPRGEEEAAEPYCRRVCERYQLHYTDRVRQNFNHSSIKANIKKMQRLIFPIIDEATKEAITDHLISKKLL